MNKKELFQSIISYFMIFIVICLLGLVCSINIKDHDYNLNIMYPRAQTACHKFCLTKNGERCSKGENSTECKYFYGVNIYDGNDGCAKLSEQFPMDCECIIDGKHEIFSVKGGQW